MGMDFRKINENEKEKERNKKREEWAYMKWVVGLEKLKEKGWK